MYKFGLPIPGDVGSVSPINPIHLVHVYITG